MEIDSSCPQDWMNTLQENPASRLLLALVEEEEGAVVSKKRLPNPITVPKKGPLILKTTTSPHVPGATAQHCVHVPNAHGRRIFKNPKYQQRPLIKHPVPMAQRPIEEIQSELGELSCAQLRDSIQLITVSSCGQ